MYSIKQRVEVVRLLVEMARPMILRRFRPSSCIASTRVAIDVLARFGMPAEPLPVTVYICNEIFARHVERVGQPATEEEARRLFEVDGGHTILIGDRPDADTQGYPGHLVCLLRPDLMIDLSIDQATRPQKGIVLRPFAVPVTADFVDGRSARVVGQNGCVLRYQRHPHRGFKNSGDWRDASRTAPIVDEIARKIRQRLRSPAACSEERNAS